MEEIKIVVFRLSSDSSLGPNDFCGFLYQTYWEILNQDMINAVLQFYNQGWIIQKFNVSVIDLIPKIKYVNTLEKFKHIFYPGF